MMGLYSNLSLLIGLARRDVSQRYANSMLGSMWLFAQPLLQLALYGFVFQVVLKTRWGVQTATGKAIPFGLILFVGLILHTLLSETLIRAPGIIIAHGAFVKRIVFPLQVLPAVVVLSALFNVVLAVAVLFVAIIVISGYLPLTAVLIVLPIGALTLLALGLSWLLAALSVYLRDLGQLMPHLSSMLLFTAPVCYPAESVPQKFRWLLEMNPLTLPITMARRLVFEGVVDLSGMPQYLLFAIAIVAIGRWFFERLRRGFADVL